MSAALTWAVLTLAFLSSIVLARYVGDGCDWVLARLHAHTGWSWVSESEPDDDEDDDPCPCTWLGREYHEGWSPSDDEIAALYRAMADERFDEEDHR